jgi:anti-sigma B factor antagonist/stage II sporulation protein AA (anti-sigma F factor antagonist)
MTVGLEIVVEIKDGKHVLRCSGRIDAASATVLEKKMNDLLKENDKWILLDFTNVHYLSSAGMRVLLSMTKKLKAKDGGLLIFHVNAEIMEIIKMAGFERILHIFPTEKDALAGR